jgi:hypothetical protein
VWVDLESLGNIGEFLGGIVVVISLFYLAFQVRQNTQSLHTESYARAQERVAGVQSQLAGDPALASILLRGTLDTRVLTPEERIQFSWLFYEMFGAFEFMFHQGQKGVLDDEIWNRWSATLSWWLSMPGVESWWHAKPAPFTASFSAEVESLLSAGAADPEAVRRFGEFMQAAER